MLREPFARSFQGYCRRIARCLKRRKSESETPLSGRCPKPSMATQLRCGCWKSKKRLRLERKVESSCQDAFGARHCSFHFVFN